MLGRLRRAMRSLERQPEWFIPLGVLAGVGLMIAGLETRGVVTLIGIFVLVFVTPLLYLRQKLLNWTDRQRKAAERPGNPNKQE